VLLAQPVQVEGPLQVEQGEVHAKDYRKKNYMKSTCACARCGQIEGASASTSGQWGANLVGSNCGIIVENEKC